jgi:hypothetical protein
MKITSILIIVAIIILLLIIKIFLSDRSTKVSLSTGEAIGIEKKTTKYNDWATGMPREREAFNIKFKGSPLSIDDIKEQINKKHPGLLESPTIYDAVKLSPDDILILVAKDSQGTGYPLIRIHNKDQMTAELIEVGEDHSEYNWFPDSRLQDWYRVVNHKRDQFMIRSRPFKIINIGQGQLTKVEYPLVFLTDENHKGDAANFKVYNLEEGKVIAQLALSKECFRLPSFSFDHPKLDRDNMTENDEAVQYNYGPKWWDKNFDYQNSKLKLKSDHVITAPPKKVYSILHQGHEVDQFDMKTMDCSNINPNGSKTAKTHYTESEQITLNEFCLLDNLAVDRALQKKACGSLQRKEIFNRGKVKLLEIKFSYQPEKIKSQAVEVVTYVMESQGKPYIQVANPDSTTDVIQNAFILNEKQLLLKARSDGPWQLYLVTIADKDPRIEHVLTYAYPDTSYEESEDHSSYFEKSSGVLVRKTPYTLFDYKKEIISAKQDVFVSSYTSEKNEYVLNLNDWNDKTKWTKSFSKTCFKEIPDVTWSLPRRERWLREHFTFVKDELILINNKCGS